MASMETANPTELGSSARSNNMIICAVVSVVIAGAVVAARFYTRLVIKRTVLLVEDWCVLVAWLMSVGDSVCVSIEAVNGFGHHTKSVPLDRLIVAARAGFITILFYILGLAFVKISILLLYIRVFSLSRTRYFAYALLVFICSFNVAGFITSITQCVPVNKIWDRNVEGHCNVNAEVYTWVAIVQHIVTDFLIFILPIVPIFRINIPLRQKIEVALVFAVGLLDCLIGILRAIFFAQQYHSSDFMWDWVIIANWSTVELNLSVIVACLVVLRPLAAKLWATFDKSEQIDEVELRKGANSSRLDGSSDSNNRNAASDELRRSTVDEKQGDV